MNARHRIRLAGPWEAEILHSSSHHELANKVFKAALDGTGQLGDHPFHGNLRLRRNFNLPTGLDENSVVWLCAEGLPLSTQCQIFLNRQPLNRTDGGSTGDRPVEIAVTDALDNFNRIEIVLSCSELDTGAAIAKVAKNGKVTASIQVRASVWLELE